MTREGPWVAQAASGRHPRGIGDAENHHPATTTLGASGPILFLSGGPPVGAATHQEPRKSPRRRHQDPAPQRRLHHRLCMQFLENMVSRRTPRPLGTSTSCAMASYHTRGREEHESSLSWLGTLVDLWFVALFIRSTTAATNGSSFGLDLDGVREGAPTGGVRLACRTILCRHPSVSASSNRLTRYAGCSVPANGEQRTEGAESGCKENDEAAKFF